MTNGRKKSTSQKPHPHPSHLPKVGSKAQVKWDRRTRLGDLEFDVAWVVGVVVIIIVLALLTYFLG
ncbi:MAG TPA: hypothetical protein PLS46_09085 [Microthrixaceae bacterium]|jgi:hypothetical protein|nr:hypothetical protein [Microthrixaceae bacterium]